jgi:hypothetical protein
MYFTVIAATLLATATAEGGSIANGKTCAKYGDCVDKSTCSPVTQTDGGTLTMMCVLTADHCKSTDTVDALDSENKKYSTKADSCLKKEDATKAKVVAGEKCTKTSECADTLSCGGSGDAATEYKCLKTDTCNTTVAEKEIKCESALRNAMSMAVAVIAVAYAL